MSELAKYEETSAIIATLARMEQGEAFTPVPPRIKIIAQGCVFKDENTGNVMNELNGIIGASLITRAYWADRNDKVPTCVSRGGRHGTSRFPEIVVGGECSRCQFNQFGTSVGQDGKVGAGKACKEMRLLLISLDGYAMPIVLTLPPTSIMNFNKYASGQQAIKSAYFAVKTKVSLEQVQKGSMTYSVAHFTAGKPLTAAELSDVSDFREQYSNYIANAEIVSDETENV
jgi:hypothetical protein